MSHSNSANFGAQQNFSHISNTFVFGYLFSGIALLGAVFLLL